MYMYCGETANFKYQVIITDSQNETVASTEFDMDLEQAERYANDYNYSAKTTYASVRFTYV